MVMTGFLPTHSIETPMDENKAQGKAEIMRNRMMDEDVRIMVRAIASIDPLYAQSDVVINALLPNPGTSGRDLLRHNPDVVTYMLRTCAITASAFNKDDILRRLDQMAAQLMRPTLHDKYGDRVDLVSLPARAMEDLPLFVAWLRAVIGMIFNVANTEVDATDVVLEAINFDVPTDEALRVIVYATDDASYEYKVPWYGRQVIKHDVSAFIEQLLISIAGDLDE